MISPDEYLDCGLTFEENILFSEQEKNFLTALTSFTWEEDFVSHNSESIPPILTLADIILMLFLVAT